MKYDNILQTVGNTPIVRLNKAAAPENVSLWVKVESFNPAGSIKDRPALNMIEDAEQRGLLKPGDTIVEPTSGNTGIGLAMVAAYKGYHAVFTMAADMSEERKLILKAYGADIVLTPAELGTQGALDHARTLEKEQGYFFVGQHFNPANTDSHKQTAQEIYEDFGADLSALVSTTGTGGTISGMGRYLKELIPHVKIVATEPAASPILTQGVACKHKIMGTAPGFIPEILDTDAYDEVLSITSEQAYQAARYLARSEGIFVGISSGAAVSGMLQLAARPDSAGKTFIAILPDTGERYLSTDLWSRSDA